MIFSPSCFSADQWRFAPTPNQLTLWGNNTFYNEQTEATSNLLDLLDDDDVTQMPKLDESEEQTIPFIIEEVTETISEPQTITLKRSPRRGKTPQEHAESYQKKIAALATRTKSPLGEEQKLT